MSFLYTTWNLRHSKDIPAGPTVQDVLNVLHDPQQALRISPIVSSVIPDPAGGENHFIVTERIRVFGSIYYPAKYKIKWTLVPDGCEWDGDANFGIKTRNEMKVKIENGVVVFTDSLTAQASLHLCSNLRFNLTSWAVGVGVYYAACEEDGVGSTCPGVGQVGRESTWKQGIKLVNIVHLEFVEHIRRGFNSYRSVNVPRVRSNRKPESADTHPIPHVFLL